MAKRTPSDAEWKSLQDGISHFIPTVLEQQVVGEEGVVLLYRFTCGAQCRRSVWQRVSFFILERSPVMIFCIQPIQHPWWRFPKFPVIWVLRLRARMENAGQWSIFDNCLLQLCNAVSFSNMHPMACWSVTVGCLHRLSLRHLLPVWRYKRNSMSGQWFFCLLCKSYLSLQSRCTWSDNTA